MAAPVLTRTRMGLALPCAPRHESFNIQTALVGLAASLVGTAWLLSIATTPRAAIAFSLYGSALALVFSSTALHHAYPESRLLRRVDHASIYAAIVGTAAPPCLLLAGAAGGLAFALVATLCAIGATAKLAAPILPPAWNLVVYLPVPLPLVAVAKDLGATVPTWGLALLLGGVVLVVAGAVIDAIGRPAPRGIEAHGVFHLSVLAGCAMMFGFVAACAIVA